MAGGRLADLKRPVRGQPEEWDLSMYLVLQQAGPSVLSQQKEKTGHGRKHTGELAHAGLFAHTLSAKACHMGELQGGAIDSDSSVRGTAKSDG